MRTAYEVHWATKDAPDRIAVVRPGARPLTPFGAAVEEARQLTPPEPGLVPIILEQRWERYATYCRGPRVHALLPPPVTRRANICGWDDVDPMLDQLVETRELIREMRGRGERCALIPERSELGRYLTARLRLRPKRRLYSRAGPDLSVCRDDLERAYQRVTRRSPQDPDYAPVWG